jgi:ABC-type phosphate transport system substrate-binding protein
MKISTKATYLACSIAAALGSSAAYAVGPGTTPDFVFYYGGGSAEPQAVGAATCRLMSNVDLYTSTAAGKPDGKYYVLYGTTTAAHGTVAAGKNVMVIYKFNGGSYPNGGVPQSSASTGLQYPTVASIVTGATATGTGAGTYCTPGNGVATFQSGANVLESTNRQPDFGLTDLEVPAFSGINNPLAPAALALPGATAGIYDLVFGMAVTPTLWAQKRNFTNSEIAGILSATITNWNQLYGDQPGFVGAALPAGDIILLDRNVGSGHKTSSSAEFLGYPQLGPLATLPTSVVNGYLGGADGVGTPPVSCIAGAGFQDIQESSAAGTVTDLKLLAAPACNLRAIGILSMDNPPGIAANQNTPGTNAYNFVALNGSAVDTGTAGDDENSATATSYVNAIKGNYTDFYQAHFNTKSAGFLTSGTPGAAFAAAYLTQLKSASLPGCSGSPGLKFPGSLPGVITDLDNASTLVGVTCVSVTSRNGNSDSPLSSFKTIPGNITLGSDPL